MPTFERPQHVWLGWGFVSHNPEVLDFKFVDFS
jgi:hypothetical protein